MVAGIVLAAFGLEHVLEHVDEPLDAEYCFALLGGVAIYLLAHVALRLRSAHTLNVQRLVLGSCCSRRYRSRPTIDALAALAAVNVLLWVMIGYETRRYGEARYPLRHGVPPEPGAPIGADRR